MLQSYEKSSAKQRKMFLFLPKRSNFANLFAKLQKKNGITNILLIFASKEKEICHSRYQMKDKEQIRQGLKGSPKLKKFLDWIIMNQRDARPRW